MTLREKRFADILKAHEGLISAPEDLIGTKSPSALCLLMGKQYSKLFLPKSDKEIRKQIVRCRFFHPLLKSLLPLIMPEKQMIENRQGLLRREYSEAPDSGIELPDGPVIWMCNHGFRDDVIASLNAVPRHAYIIFGSLPQFYNTFDGLSASINGVVMTNRKMRKTGTVERAVQVLKNGADIIIFPEGIWNKSPNQLALPLWPGIYHMALQSGAKIVPVVHYIQDPANPVKENTVHTVLGNPISMDGLTEQQGLELLRDTMATWYYLMVERYGKTTRKALIGQEEKPQRIWEQYLQRAVSIVERYDPEIELRADFRPRSIPRPETVWAPVADMTPSTSSQLLHQIYAQRLVNRSKQEDFQRRF